MKKSENAKNKIKIENLACSVAIGDCVKRYKSILYRSYLC